MCTVFRVEPVDGVQGFAYSTYMRMVTDDLPISSRDGDRVALIRLTGELTTKARRTRARFQRRLARNIQAAFAASGQEYELRESWSRLLLRLEPGGSFSTSHPTQPAAVRSPPCRQGTAFA